ncbi:hypothetical protein [Polyangium spumosum]|uniref:Uncharacterized protein n=1 Tax=Polyangium spumosum TaxID=889282 RepID=A0A6N7PVY0_9BACT|nr:hypothetical protein [Polyangium spumosum]MRG96059.1 hypothetical protein [Polyangium spumosum]
MTAPPQSAPRAEAEPPEAAPASAPRSKPREPAAVTDGAAAVAEGIEASSDGVAVSEVSRVAAPPAADAPATPATSATPSSPPPSSPPTPRNEERPRETPQKPLLASEALMEDLAPIEPSRQAARFWCAAVGLGFAGLGALPYLGVRPGGTNAALSCLLFGGVTLAAALTRVSYRHRAVAMLLLGTLAAVVGLGGAGPAAGIAAGAPVLGFARLLAATALPAALLFRARYRAYAGARWLLAAAFVCALPFLILTVLRVAPLSPELATIGSFVAIFVVAAALVGFMGSETTGAGTYVGLGVLSGLGTELALSDLSYPGAFATWQSPTSTILAAVAFVAATGLSALGLFQILAWRLSGDARRINIHAAVPEKPRRKPEPTTTSDWSSSD